MGDISSSENFKWRTGIIKLALVTKVLLGSPYKVKIKGDKSDSMFYKGNVSTLWTFQKHD